MKPPDLNRGQGIRLLNNLDFVFRTLNQFASLPTTDPHKNKVKSKTAIVKYDGGQVSFQIETPPHQKDRVVIFQKYLSDPMLYHGRKFDFRVWVLVDHQLNYYFFREGYLRLASEPYDTNDLKNLYKHLTNNAIQKSHPKYERYELGNQLSFDDLQVAQ